MNHNLYSHYIQTTRPPQTITTDVIASMESDLTGASFATEMGGKLSRGGCPKRSTTTTKEELAIQIIMAKNHAAVEFDKLKREAHMIKQEGQELGGAHVIQSYKKQG